MTKLRFGSLGCGRIVLRGLIPGITGSPVAELHALASLRPGVAQKLAAETNCPKAYDSYEAIIADPDIDAVYIPTSGEEHHRWTLCAAAAGKHVLCEKSLARSVSEAEEMVATCQRAGVILQEAFMWRHHPRSKRVKQLLADGTIGDLRHINASFSFDIDPNDWRLDWSRGGGASWDVGCYGVNASRHFAGAEPVKIYATGRYNDRGADTTMQIALRFPNDITANVDCSFEMPYRCRVELVGSKGTIEIPDAFLPPPQAALLVRRGTSPDHVPERVMFETANQYVEEINDFCASVAAKQLFEPAENGLANMRVLEEANRQARASGGREPPVS